MGLLGQGEDRDSFTDSPAKVEHHSFSTEVLSESSQHGTQPICESCCGSLDCRSLREPSGVRARLALRPVLILGTLLGIIHSAEKGRLRSPSFYYSVVMTCGLWANVVLSFRNYSRISFNSMMFLQITLHVVSTEMAVMNSTFLLNTSAQLPRLFREWDKYIHRYHCSTVQRVRSFGLLMIVLIYVILLLVMSGVFVIYVLETRGVSNRSELLIKHYFAQASGLFEGVTSLWVPFIICCISLFQVCIWFWPVIFLVTICYGLKVNFQELSTVLKSKLSSLDEAGLEAYRFRYQELCKIVNMVDDIFSLLAIFIYLTGIPLLCFSVYNFAFPFKEHAQWSFLFVVVADIGFLVGQVGMVTISASALSSQVSEERLFYRV